MTASVEEYKELSENGSAGLLELQNQASYAEEMKSHLNEYRRMVDLQNEVERLKAESEELRRKSKRHGLFLGKF